MSRLGAAALRAALGLMACLAVASAIPQEPTPPEKGGPPEEKERVRVTEVGGRLVVSSETVDVVAASDEPVLRSSIATKTDTPLLDTPRSISIADRQTLDDLQTINITQTHDHTAGFSPEDERGPGLSRGFRVGFYELRRDGLRTYAWSVREPAALDRIQYLRGPTSVLYGDGSPGGLVNLVLKKPLPAPRYEASVGLGELGFRRLTADATGPLSSNRGVRYRLVAAGEWLDDGFDNDESRKSVLPMVSFDLGAKTTLHLDGEYYDQRGRGYRHSVPATAQTQRGDFSAIPWDLNMASPDDGWRGWNVSGGLRLDAQLSPTASLHVAGRYTKIDGDLDIQAPAGLAPDDRTALRFHYREKSIWGEYQGDTFAAFSAATGPVRHRLVGGLEAGLSTVESEIGIGPAPSLDIYDPVYGPKPPEPALAPSGNHLLRLGLYVQDQLQISTRWSFIPALRWSRLRLEDRAPAANGLTTTDNAFTPSAGLVFLPRPWLSFYASYAEGFEPPVPGQFLEDGRALDPMDSRSMELGAKADS